ncbi:MAG: PTS sugar transporter subunit IIA [Fusobacterium sp. JB019]|nr:PTS sugar transporter subunit IIA [Fusobacterium sp. JB020]MDP0505774.1 PTS sugar transporter subunit IIA [Fusobacterium sp. JB019]
MLEKELEGKIVVVDQVKDWKEAIRKVAEPLLKRGEIENSYVDAIFNKIEKMGNYIIIEPKIAMPHARPEDGVNKTCISLLKINEGVLFDGEDEKVYLIFMLAASDNSSHIDILKDLMNIIDDEDQIEKLILAKSIEETKKLLK